MSRAETLALDIRAQALALTSCCSTLTMTADYGQRVYEYTLDMVWNKEQGLTLALTAPQEVAGVTVRVEAGETALEYEGIRIETGAITPDGLSPVDAIPALLRYACEGFIAACTQESLEDTETLHVVYRDGEGTPGVGTEAALWFDTKTHAPLVGELSVDGTTVIRCVFSAFTAA